MRRALSLLCLAIPSFASPVLGFEHSVEYRFSGVELTGFAITEGPDEDPALLSLSLLTDSMGPITLEIESDLGFGDCAAVLGMAQGDPGTSIVLQADLNARTLNGVTLLRCSAH
ncbi:hypothetical protein [Sagittula salina]|uniref:Uncharacterized protein n=1 Tax=Sagittula salina TaxID=2820268 RepID=A0A940MMD8_9RHOB|nr:hypothetical protein [Sagittula salina]MBP0482385.1 hypothetical protein [Sagittula salina]